MQTFLRTVAKVVGSEVDRRRRGLLPGVRGHGGRVPRPGAAVEELLAAPRHRVRAGDVAARATPSRRRCSSPPARRERPAIDALIVNRVHPTFGDEAPAGLRAAAAELSCARARAAIRRPQRLAVRYENLADFREIAELERDHLRGVHERSASTSIAYVPYLSRDVYDFSALREIGATPVRGNRQPLASSAPASMTTILVAADAQWVRDQVRSAFVGPGQEVVEVTRGRTCATRSPSSSPTS